MKEEISPAETAEVVQTTDNMTFQLLDIFMYCTMLNAYCMWADLLGNGVGGTSLVCLYLYNWGKLE